MRPGGLTALAVFNFVFGGLSGLINLIGLATFELRYKELQKMSEIQGQSIPSKGVLYALLAFAIVRAALLITSGIGYLGRKKLWGYILGNAYGVLALVAIAVEIALAPQNFTVFSLVDFVYPLITLFLLNVIFRKDFA